MKCKRIRGVKKEKVGMSDVVTHTCVHVCALLYALLSISSIHFREALALTE